MKDTLIFSIVIFIAAIIIGGIATCNKVGSTVVERKIYENSYQRTASIKEEILSLSVELENINRDLSNPTLSEFDRSNLESQKRSLENRIQIAKGK